jgi:hypothetical protein
MNKEFQCRIHKGSQVIPILSPIKSILRINTYFFKVHSNIVLPSTPRPPQSNNNNHHHHQQHLQNNYAERFPWELNSNIICLQKYANFSGMPQKYTSECTQ